MDEENNDDDEMKGCIRIGWEIEESKFFSAKSLDLPSLIFRISLFNRKIIASSCIMIMQQ